MNPNVVKGLLVLLVVVDHNDFSRSVFPGFLYGFSFHVLGFMSLPFLRPAPMLDRQFGQYLFRLYHPFLVLVTALCLGVALFTTVAPMRQLELWALSLYSGNPDVLKSATHLAMLWYLPSFVALVALGTGIRHMHQAGKVAAIGALCLLHPLIGVQPGSFQDYLPLGLLPALYVAPLAMAAVWVHARLLERLPRSSGLGLTLLLYGLVKALQMRANLYNELGFAAVADYTRPFDLMLNDLEAVTGVWMVFQLGRFHLGWLIATAGKYSLQVYLFHPFVAAVIYKLLVAIGSGMHPVLLFSVSFALTAVFTVLLSRFLAEQETVKRLMFPRNTTELACALHLPALRPHGIAAAHKAENGNHDR